MQSDQICSEEIGRAEFQLNISPLEVGVYVRK